MALEKTILKVVDLFFQLPEDERHWVFLACAVREELLREDEPDLPPEIIESFILGFLDAFITSGLTLCEMEEKGVIKSLVD